MIPARILFAVLPAAGLFAQSPVSVDGTVVDSVTGLGISAVSVRFRSDAGEYQAATDPSGRFQISGMADGQYGSEIDKAGYVPRDSAAESSPLPIIRVAAGQDAAHMRVELVPYAKLRGRVVDPEGKPVANVTLTFTHGEAQVTDEQGQFTLTNVVPGSYFLQATPAPNDAAGNDRIELLPTWYPSAVEHNLAQPIIVRGGADLTGFEIRLQSSPVYRVRGVLLGENGPVARAHVTDASETDKVATFLFQPPKLEHMGPLSFFILSRADAGTSGSAQTAADGAFELPSVPRGLRRFTATLAAPRLGRIQAAEASIVVDHDIDDLAIQLNPPVGIDGTIESAGTPPGQTPDAVLKAVLIDDGVALTLPGGKRSGNRFHFDGTSPGASRIVAAPGVAGGYYLDSISLGSQDITWRSFDLEAGAPPIRVLYKPNGGTVTGTVESPDGATVVLIPQSALDSLDVQYGRVSPRSASSAFEIDSVAPGSYYAFAVDRVEPEKLSNAAAVHRIVNTATVVQVTEGATVTVKVDAVHFDD